MEDMTGHGTSAAKIIQKIAPDADIYSVKDRKKISIQPLDENGYPVWNYYILTHNGILTDGGNGMDEEHRYYFYSME